ncbi:UNVERIFIED_ORG: uncharacterized protein YbcV (DUF1398 family) [Rhizobium esperanzae]
MYDFAFDYRSLKQELLPSDFAKDPQLADEAVKEAVLASSQALASTGFNNLVLQQSLLRGKPVYQVVPTDQNLVLRKFSRNIRRLTRVKQSDRDTIIKSLKALFQEGHNFRVYKLDIRNFYESIDRDFVGDLLKRDNGLPPTTLYVYQSFNASLAALNIYGLPRGLAVSAILSEYAMRQFDRSIKSYGCVYYYARYVDDIIVVTTGRENKKDFKKYLIDSLPSGLQLNYSKTRISDFTRPKVNSVNQQTSEGKIDFLGYQFNIFGQLRMPDRSFARKVLIDISENKKKRFQTRITLSALQFRKDANFTDFYDRIRVLSGNYNVYDMNRKIRRNVGILYNYRFIDIDYSDHLLQIDRFMKALFLSNTGNLSASFATLSKAQRRKILSLSFQRSFRTGEFHHFQISRLSDLVRCWAYE